MVLNGFESIQVGSIQVVGREGLQVKLQCLKADIKNLPLKGIESGSSCFILDATGAEEKVYIFHKTEAEENGTWYAVDSGEAVEIVAGQVVYNSNTRCVEQLGGI